jgi:hypothetical protein
MTEPREVTGTIWDDAPVENQEMVLYSPIEIKPAKGAGEDMGAAYTSLIQMAQNIKRDPGQMIRTAAQVGGLLGQSGFYRFPVGGAQVEGASIGLAQALAQAWRGIVYQVHILHSEPLGSGGRRIHLRARVLDLQAVVVVEMDQVVSTSAPPGKFANNPEQSERWHTMQTQSAASKVMRNAILRVLPDWYVDAGFEAAREAAAKTATGGKPLPAARMEALGALAGYGATKEDLELAIGMPVDLWAAPQLQLCRDLFVAFKSGNLSIEAWKKSLQPEAAPARPTGKSALGIASTPADLSTEIGRMEAEIGPERTAALRKEYRIGPEVKAADISPLLADPYRKALIAAMPA